MSSSVDANVFKVRHHSAIMIETPILISFLMPVFLSICLFINFSRKPAQKWFVASNLCTLPITRNEVHLTLFTLKKTAGTTKAHLLLSLEPSDV